MELVFSPFVKSFTEFLLRVHVQASRNTGTPGLLPGKSLAQRSLAGYSPRGGKALDMTEHTHRIYLFIIQMFKQIYV